MASRRAADTVQISPETRPFELLMKDPCVGAPVARTNGERMFACQFSSPSPWCLVSRFLHLPRQLHTSSLFLSQVSWRF